MAKPGFRSGSAWLRSALVLLPFKGSMRWPGSPWQWHTVMGVLPFPSESRFWLPQDYLHHPQLLYLSGYKGFLSVLGTALPVTFALMITQPKCPPSHLLSKFSFFKNLTLSHLLLSTLLWELQVVFSITGSPKSSRAWKEDILANQSHVIPSV